MNQYEAQVVGLAIVCTTIVIRWVLQYLFATEPRNPLDDVEDPFHHDERRR